MGSSEPIKEGLIGDYERTEWPRFGYAGRSQKGKLQRSWSVDGGRLE